MSLFIDGGKLSALTATESLPLESSPTPDDYADASLLAFVGTSGDPSQASPFDGTLFDLRIYAATLDNRCVNSDY